MDNYTITFTQEEMQVINAALGEMPYRLAAPLIHSINQQIAKRDERKATDEDQRA